jgi:hypothetical protein
VAIVLNHDLELLDDGQARVCSQSHGQVVYHVVNGECTCKDYAKAPSGWCAYSTDFCHPVHGIVAMQSMGMLPPSPEDCCHPIHGIVATLGA